MGVQHDKTRRKYVVRWREDGRQRNRRFATQEAAETFNETLHRRRARPSEPVAPIVRPRAASNRYTAGQRLDPFPMYAETPLVRAMSIKTGTKP
jgi:hypothetical protein